MKILLVEDEETLRNALKEYLGHRGFQVMTAANGATAFDAVRKLDGELGCLVTDFRMPLMDGVELTRGVRSAFRNESLPVIVMSGDGIEDEAFAAGATAFLRKPFLLDELLEAVCSATGCRPSK